MREDAPAAGPLSSMIPAVAPPPPPPPPPPPFLTSASALERVRSSFANRGNNGSLVPPQPTPLPPSPPWLGAPGAAAPVNLRSFIAPQRAEGAAAAAQPQQQQPQEQRPQRQRMREGLQHRFKRTMAHPSVAAPAGAAAARRLAAQPPRTWTRKVGQAFVFLFWVSFGTTGRQKIMSSCLN